MKIFTKDNKINCQKWHDVGEDSYGICTHAQAPKTFNWPENSNHSVSKGFCANHCLLRQPIDINRPVILGEMTEAPTPKVQLQLPKRDRQSWWSRKQKEPNGKDFGPKLWKKLHEWAATADLLGVDKWLEGFSFNIPCGDCRGHWLKMVANNPAPKTSNRELAYWTFSRHNQVNLAKENPSPELTWNEAVILQNWPLEWLDPI